MKILTKLMLASAVMVTSGFAVPGDPVSDPDPVIDGTLEIRSGAEWETTQDHTITSAGAVTLEKAAVEGEGARWIISEGNTVDVQGGSVTIVGEGEYGPTVNLGGTMKLTKNNENYPVVKLDGANVVGEKIKFWEYETSYESYPPSSSSATIQLYESDFEQVYSNFYYVNDKFPFFTSMTGVELGGIMTGQIIYPIGAKVEFKAYGETGSFVLPGIGEEGVTVSYSMPNQFSNGFAPLRCKFYDADGIEQTVELRLRDGGTSSSNIRVTNSAGYTFVLDSRECSETEVKNCVLYGFLSYYNSGGLVDCNGEAYRSDAVAHNVYENHVQKGFINASPLRAFAQTATAVEDLSSNISGINPSTLAEVKLPFNCKFGAMNLSNVDKVSFTKFIKGKTYEPEIVSNVIGMTEIAGETYGDYESNADLGVVLPTEASKLAVTTETTADGVAEFDLQTIAEDATYNAEDGNLKINTKYLSANAHELAGDFTYNVGFTGDGNPIKISGTNVVATFKGDASEYAPNGNITLTNKTVYAGNNSFIKKSHAYGELEFAAAASEDPEDALVNEIPSGVEVSATKFSVGKGHTLTVKGKLRA